MKLIIVESPAKARKIAGFLGEGWQVEATRGHIRDLPEKELGVNVEADFAPTYRVLPGKGNLVRRLKKAMHEANIIYLATDPDREGEAIAWHVLDAVAHNPNKQIYRATFNAITDSAVKNALENPSQLDTQLVGAQESRRIVDRLVGYLVSPLACKALNQRLSAGRVQSVALRLVVDREREIEDFTPETYWTVSVKLQANDVPFEAHLHKLKNADTRFTTRERAEKLTELLKNSVFWVNKTSETIKSRHPSPPFTTSTLQQVASSLLGFSPEKTMRLAQSLYEDGRITYHRTDSVHIDPEAQTAARIVIQSNYGDAYVPENPTMFKAKSANAQEAHEAIRPTKITQIPNDDGSELYALIWKRFIASQMAPAQYAVTGALIHAGKSPDKPLPLIFKASGRKQIFDGFLRVYDDKADADEQKNITLPTLKDGQSLTLVDVPITEGQTRPPSRFSEASLIGKLETLGVGRPSTYASTVKVLKKKGYVTLKSRQFSPTQVGLQLCDFTTQHFPKVFDVGYTARLETALDRVASGKMTRTELLNVFWNGFQPQLKTATEYALSQVKLRPQPKPIGEKCPECGSDLVERQGENGAFVGCSRYPTCTYTRKYDAKPLVLHPVED